MADETWRAALEAAETELESVEASMHDLRKRADALRAAISGLRTLLGEGPRGNAGLASPEMQLAMSDLSAVALDGLAQLKKATKAGIFKGLSSTDLATLLLETVGRPLSMQQIRLLYGEIGWVDGDWKNSSANIHMAVRRAHERGGVLRLSDGRWVAVKREEGSVTLKTRKTRSGDGKP